MNYCECGCGQLTKSRFVPGHDSKHKSKLSKAWREDNDVNALAEMRSRGWVQIGTDNRTFGIEIEMFVPNHIDRATILGRLQEEGLVTGYSGWKIVGDGSINSPGGHQGMELVSPILKGASGREQVEKACRVLHAVGAKVNRSCGLHVHHGVDDLKVKNFKSLLRLYGKFEGQIDEMVAMSRRVNNSSYCHSVANINEHVFARSVTVRTLANAVNGGSRYSKLNLTAYVKHGTVEFRQHQGSVEAYKILAWVDFGQALIKAAKRDTAQRFHTGHGILDVAELTSEQVAYWNNRKAILAA